LFVILSGTNARGLHNVIRTSSGKAPREIPLPLLKISDMEEFLDFLKRGRGRFGVCLAVQVPVCVAVAGRSPEILGSSLFHSWEAQ
jgi:hypothetical protein